MPVINCLSSAKKAYGDDLSNDEITDIYAALENHKKMAENTGANTLEELNSFSKELMDEKERSYKIHLYQQLLKGQVIADNLQRIKLFTQAGHLPKNAVPRALIGKMVGSEFKVARGKDSSFVRQSSAVDKFYSSFANDIQGELLPYFTSKDGQLQLVQAMYDHRNGKPSDTPFGKLAAIVIKYQDMVIKKNEEVGIFVTRLHDRVAPNVHNPEKITSLSMKEKRTANSLYPAAGDPQYEYAFQRWKADVRPKLDDNRTFTMNNVDVNNPEQVDAFLRSAFDNVVNKGKASQTNVNFANKFQMQRVLHWKDAQSLIDYNEKYGSGSIQDSIIRELSNQFGMHEIMRDWTIDPMGAIDATLETVDVDKDLVQRFKKSDEYKNVRDIMKAMITRDAPDSSAISSITSFLTAFESATKLGMALPASITDLVNTSRVARELGTSRFTTYAEVAKRFIFGMSDDDKRMLSDFVNSGFATKLGQINRYAINPYDRSSYRSWANHWIYKLSLLHRWDDANRSYAASVTGQYLAKHRNIAWDKMTDHDKAILGEYNINQHDWELIRQSSTKTSGNGRYIMPDCVQDVSDEAVVASLKAQGVDNPTALRMQMYKDNVERKMTSFFRDRQNHAIVAPDAVDRSILSFGAKPDQTVYYNAIRIITQFKHFGVALVRKSLLPILRENGATTMSDSFNPFSGKSNWRGMGAYGAEVMALGYIGLTLKNLALGESPPSLAKEDTWIKLTKSALGAMEIAFNVDLTDVKGTIGGLFEGVAGSDIEKTAKLIRNFSREYGQGLGYDKTKQSAFQLARSGIPFNGILTKWLTNHFLLNEMEDWAYPGKRLNDLQQLQQTTGATQLF